MKAWFAVTAMLMSAVVVQAQNEPGVQEAIRFERAKAAASAAQAQKEGSQPSRSAAAALPKTSVPKRETVSEAVQFERRKLAAAAAQERKEQLAARKAGRSTVAE
jgi:hypothetical protein